MQLNKKYIVYLEVANYPKIKLVTKYIHEDTIAVFNCYIDLLRIDPLISNNLYITILNELNET